MADERLLRGIRRFWTKDQVRDAYEAILTAYQSRLENVTVIVGKGTEGENASAQVVVGKADYLEWMDVLEARLTELEAAEAGTSGPPEGSTTLGFHTRIIAP